MATDDERRRVAAALRGYVRRYEAPTWKALCNIVLGREEGAGDLRKIHTLDRLADLIEPSCDRDALLELADEMEYDADVENAAKCDPMLGSIARMQVKYANRIREALGEGA